MCRSSEWTSQLTLNPTFHGPQRRQAQALAEAAQRAAQPQVDVVLDRPVGQVVPQPCRDWRWRVLLCAGTAGALAVLRVGDTQRPRLSSNYSAAVHAQHTRWKIRDSLQACLPMMTPGSALPSKRASGDGNARVGLYGIVKKMWHCNRSTRNLTSLHCLRFSNCAPTTADSRQPDSRQQQSGRRVADASTGKLAISSMQRCRSLSRLTGMPIFSATCRWLYTGGLEMMACAVKGSPPAFQT
jgi:hypothetical protein